MENTSLVGSENYAATVITVKELIDLPGLDNLKGLQVFGYQSLVSKNTKIGSRVVVFVAGAKLSPAFAAKGNLFRHAELNEDKTQKGYLVDSGRIEAIKLQGHRSDALALDVSILGDCNVADLKPFDTVNGVTICEKYVSPSTKRDPGPANGTKAQKAALVSSEQFPEHYDTPQFARNRHRYAPEDHVVITQKLHGTSIRFGNVKVARKLTIIERLAKLFGAKVQETENAFVVGSRRVTKSVYGETKTGPSYYSGDLWTSVASRHRDMIRPGYMVFGEVIGWTGTGGAIQKGYTYGEPDGANSLYVYRVTLNNGDGSTVDLSWDDVEHFCERAGLKTVPVLLKASFSHFERTESTFVDHVLSSRFPNALPLSDPNSVDEGVCIRNQAGVVTKFTSPIFLRHESKMMDAEVVDLEEAAAE